MSLLTDTSIRPLGLEHERLAGVIVPIQVGLQRYGHIPYWNSYLSNGVPLINNAFSYLFNPFHSLPVLILGGVTGSKLAILIALLIAGYNMWAFALAVGLGTVARITTAALYMLNGSLIAKFGAGHFQLACSLAWPPLVFATLWWTLHSPKRLAPVTVGISFALLFYAGNIYYVLHTAICCIVIVALHLIQRTESRWQFQWDRLLRVSIAALMAFGLSALQFFPVWQTRDFVTHAQQNINPDGTLSSSYNLSQSIANLTQPYAYWALHHPTSMYDAVDYAYIGNLVLALILLATALYITRRLLRKPRTTKPYGIAILSALILALLMMLWAGGQVQPFPWLYANIPLLAQFRFLGRALAIAALWWILLGGIALDTLWHTVNAYRLSNKCSLTLNSKPALASWLAIAAQVALLGIIVLGIWDTITVNTPTLQFSVGAIPFDTIYDDIRRADPATPVPAISLPSSSFTFGAYEHQVRIWSLNEGWSPAAPPKSALIMNRLSNPPRWLIAERNQDGILQDTRVNTVIASIGYELRACYVADKIMQLSNCSVHKAGFNLYEFPQSLPYAFVVSDPILTNNPTNLHADQVTAADIVEYRQDTIVIRVNDQATDFDKHYLVLQEANFPGWQAAIDSIPVQTITVPTYFSGQQTLGLIALPTQRGDHTYTLHFEPPGLSIGILVFCATLVLIGVYLTYRTKQKSLSLNQLG